MNIFPTLDSKILVAGDTGLLESVISHKLKEAGYSNVYVAFTSLVDFTNQEQTRIFFNCSVSKKSGQIMA
jgi:hypothetical protein